MSEVTSGNVLTGTVSKDVIVKGTVNVGNVKLPDLANPGGASDLLFGKQLFNAKGEVITGELDVEQTKEDYLADVHHKVVAEIVNSKMTGELISSWQKNNTALRKIDLPLITKINYSTFSGCSSLEEINLPAVNTISAEALCPVKVTNLYLPSLTTMTDWGWTFSASAFERVYFPKLRNITTGSFQGCYKLNCFILGADTVCTLEDSNVFTGTPIANGTGYVYVPRNLVNSYKVATNWSALASRIRAIEDYPEVLEGWE